MRVERGYNRLGYVISVANPFQLGLRMEYGPLQLVRMEDCIHKASTFPEEVAQVA